MGDRLGVCEIVDRDHFHVRVLKGGSEKNPSNSTKTVDTQFYSHFNLHMIVSTVRTSWIKLPEFVDRIGSMNTAGSNDIPRIILRQTVFEMKEFLIH
jgi:hypothetical protein